LLGLHKPCTTLAYSAFIVPLLTKGMATSDGALCVFVVGLLVSSCESVVEKDLLLFAFSVLR
jgi:hypothetical protein